MEGSICSSTEATSYMEPEAFTDWKGRAIDKKRHGGPRAASFICFKAGMTSVTNVPNFLLLVTYLHSVMHLAIAKASTTMTNFLGATCAFAIIGGFLSDSYVTRFKTILIFGPLQILGYGLLAIGAHFQSFHPPQCDPKEANCRAVHGPNSLLLNLTLYLIALGEGVLRANVASFGGDQFDDADARESPKKSSFFNWFTFSLSAGGFVGLILIVWAQQNKGWAFAFALSAGLSLVGMLVIASGYPFYRNQRPCGSPLTRVLKVFVAAFINRKLAPPESEGDLHQEYLKEGKVGGEVLKHTSDFRFLDNAAIYKGSAGGRWQCTVTQVEETKILLRLTPIFVSAVITYIPIPLLITFTVQQGTTMNRSLGSIQLSPATLFVIPVTLQMVVLAAYDKLFVPRLRRLTAYKSGIAPLQRVGVGFVATALATCVAALVEERRKRVAEEHGLVDGSAALPMSMFWLGGQFFFLAIVDASTFVGLLELFNGEFSRGMKSLGTAIFWCILGLGSFIGSILVHVVNSATGQGESVGWLEGNNLNRNHLDRFYWLLSVFGLVGFLNYLFWARRYVYRHNPRDA